MEAFIVTPAPPQVAKSSNSATPAEHNVSEASFAPTLSQAITNRKSSPTGKQDNGAGKPSPADSKETAPQTATSLQEDFSGEAEEQVSFAPGQANQDTALFLIASSYSQTGKMSFLPTGAINSLTNTESNQQGQGVPSLQALKNLTTPSAISTPSAILSAEAMRAINTAGNSTASLSSSALAALQGDGATKVAGEPQGTLSAQSSEKILELLNTNDTIAWRRDAKQAPHAIIRNLGLLPTQFEQGILSPKNSLSPEKIIAHLTDLSMDTGNTSLREKPLILRQDLTSQFFNAKIQQQNAGSEQKSGQQFLQGEQEAGKQNSLTQSFKTSNSPVETSFSQSLNTVATDKSTPLPVEQMRPATPFPNAAVSENEILQQVAQKFRISQHLQNSRIVMKLHPAELGDMKVDIHLKDGTINASIQVQSRQVLEVLERNMPRLKELMEQQGLRIDEIVLNIDKDMPADHNLFEDQLAQNENPFFNRKKSTSHISFNLNTEDPTAVQEEESNPSQAAVNVTI